MLIESLNRLAAKQKGGSLDDVAHAPSQNSGTEAPAPLAQHVARFSGVYQPEPRADREAANEVGADRHSATEAYESNVTQQSRE